MSRSPSTRSRGRRKRFAILGAVIVGPGLGALGVLSATNAAFSATTTNPSNNWTAGSVALTDNDSNAALFSTASGPNDGVLKPGQPLTTRCIKVNYTGNLASVVKLYANNPTAAPGGNTLDQWVKVTVEQGTGLTGTGGDCSGFATASTLVNASTLATFKSTYGNYTNGLTLWTTAAGADTKSYRFTVTLDANTPSTPTTVMGAQTGVDFVWEAQNS